MLFNSSASLALSGHGHQVVIIPKKLSHPPEGCVFVMLGGYIFLLENQRYTLLRKGTGRSSLPQWLASMCSSKTRHVLSRKLKLSPLLAGPIQ